MRCVSPARQQHHVQENRIILYSISLKKIYWGLYRGKGERCRDEVAVRQRIDFHGIVVQRVGIQRLVDGWARGERKRETGGTLKPPVSASQAKKSKKSAARRKSFCARMGGMPGPMEKNGKPTRKALALRKWDC